MTKSAVFPLLLYRNPRQSGGKENKMNRTELEPDTRKVLDRIRHSHKALSVYEMPADLAEAAVWEIGRMVLDNLQLPVVEYNQYRWFLRELSKLLRTQTGWDLALELEICLRKWLAYRLNPVLLQALVRGCYDRIGAMSPEAIESRADAAKSEARSPNDESIRKRTSAEKVGVGNG